MNPSSADRASVDHPRRSELLSRVIAGVGMVLSLFGTLNVISAVRDTVRVFRFGIGSYVGSYNLGTGVFDFLLSILFLGLGWLLIRRRLSREFARRAFLIALAVALVLGIVVGSSE